MAWPLYLIENQQKREIIDRKIISELSKEASKLLVTEKDLIATDWLNGRRTPDADQSLKGSMSGLTLGTTAPMIFKALVEATAFGSKAIVDRLIESGIEINEVIALGGVAKKSPFVMQTLSNILNMVIKVAKSNETCALGVAMYASVVGDVYNTIQEAQNLMGNGIEREYHPDPTKAIIYKQNYKRYLELGSLSLKAN